MIKNVIFDVGNVLVNFRPLEVMGDLNFPEDIIKALNEKMIMSTLWNELDLSIRPMKEVFQDMIDKVPEYKEYAKKFFEKADEMCICYDYSEDWLKSFKEKGYNTYILSNYSKELWEIHEKLKVFKFLPYIDGKVVSGYVQKIKPDPAIYDILLKTYNLNPKECVFFDDRQINIDAAKKKGINGILFTSKINAEKGFDKLTKGE